MGVRASGLSFHLLGLHLLLPSARAAVCFLLRRGNGGQSRQAEIFQEGFPLISHRWIFKSIPCGLAVRLVQDLQQVDGASSYSATILDLQRSFPDTDSKVRYLSVNRGLGWADTITFIYYGFTSYNLWFQTTLHNKKVIILECGIVLEKYTSQSPHLTLIRNVLTKSYIYRTGWVAWLEHHPIHQNVVCLIPGQGTYLGCVFKLQ